MNKHGLKKRKAELISEFHTELKNPVPNERKLKRLAKKIYSCNKKIIGWKK